MEVKIHFLDKTKQADKQLKDNIKKSVKSLLKKFSLPETQMGIHFVEADEIKRINKNYRKKDKAADVISFPIDEPLKGKKEGTEEMIILGDIFLCPEIIGRRSKGDGKENLKKEIIKTVKHGVGHLLGLDHKEKKEKEKFDKLIK